MQSLYPHLPLIVALVFFYGFVSSAIASARDRDPIGWFVLGSLFGVFAFCAVLWLQPVPPDHLR